MNRDHCRRSRHQADRSEARDRIVRSVGFDERANDEIDSACNEQRLAIGESAGRSAHANISSGPGKILDIELRAEPLRQLLRDDPGDDIDRPARRKRYDDPHLSLGIIDGVSGAPERRGEREHAHCDDGHNPHWRLLIAP
jgi:hypothetical protein